MTKRRLNSRQIQRQKHIQAQRLQDAQQPHEPIQEASSNSANQLGPPQPGLLIAHYGTTLIVESQAAELFRCTVRQNLGALVTGDEIIWQQVDATSGIVIACQPRRSVITRAHLYDTKPIVANIDLMIIVVALEPLPLQSTLDRYLLLAQTFNVTPLIVLNKTELPLLPIHTSLIQQLEIYQQMGYSTFRVSTKTKQGYLALEAAIQNQNSILVGQSGVGKSSLLNSLIPEAKAHISALSAIQRGRNTTTASTLYHLPGGGNIIDSPGIHQFKLRHFSKEAILKGFGEFQPFLGQCQYRNCVHQHEPGCALLQAVQKGDIAAFRLENYHLILEDLTTR